MDSYPVVWLNGTEVVCVGKLEFGPQRLRLVGAVEQEIPYSAVAGLRVGRHLTERICGRRSLVIDLADGEHLRIGSLGGPGTLHELAERLSHATAEKIPA